MKTLNCWIAVCLLVLPGCSQTTAQPKKPARMMSRFVPGQKVIAFNELDVWIDPLDNKKWTVNDFGNHGFPIIPTKTELKVVSDTKEPADEWRLVRVLAKRCKLVLDTGDGHFAPDEFRDHEFCVTRRDLRDAATIALPDTSTP